MKGSFFNYNSSEVREALNNLGNVLSNNILIDKSVFESLLAKAVEKTLILILSPYEFFISLFSDKGDVIHIDELKKDRKYIKINVHLFDAFLRRLEEKNISHAARNSITDIFNEVCEKFSETPNDPEDLIRVLSKTLPLDLILAYHEKEPGRETARKIRTTHDMISPNLITDKKILLDKFQDEKSDTLADFLQRKTVDSIRKSITINQKFMFVKELFKEDEVLFTRTINDLDDFEKLKEAENYLEVNFFRNNQWQRESEAVVEFLDVLQKKFA